MTGPQVKRGGRGLRDMPGFGIAAVAFVLTVLLGGGGVAVAKWNQSATATINITAGSAASPTPTHTTSPKPTPAPTATPAPTPTPTPSTPPAPQTHLANIATNQVLAQRPELVKGDKIACSTNGNSGWLIVDWSEDKGTAASYIVSLQKVTSGPVLVSQSVTSKNFTYKFDSNDPGDYLLRIQGMSGNVAGDAVYKTVKYSYKDVTCEHTSDLRQSPLGAFAATATPNGNVLNLGWEAPPAGATEYVVSVQHKDKDWGAEFTTTLRASALTFPPNNSKADGDYVLRIWPMKGTQAGDAVTINLKYESEKGRVVLR